jgi:drug/metabolite transporter (DMT)-like permease
MVNIANGALLLGVVFWAATFVVIKEAVEFVDVYSFISVRFLIASAILSLIFFRRFRNYDLKVLKKGVLIGIILAASFIFQVTGIKFTTASNAAFITGLSVVLVPIFVCSIDRKLPKAMQIMAVVLAFAGLVLLTLRPGFGFNAGDMWTLLCAVTFGIHLIMISRLVKKIDVPMFVVTQFLTVAVISAAIGLLFNGQIVISDQFVVWRAILFCAIFASAYMYTAQAHFQRYITEIKAAIIYSFEPLFAAVMAFLYLGEMLTPQAIIGGLLIFIGMLLSELKLKSKTALPGAT